MTEAVHGEQASPLDQAQEFTDASSYQVRDELAALIERDLLGPWDGELEVLPPRSAGPGERYLVGRLGPRHDPQSGRAAAGDAVETEIAAGGDGADGELPDLLTMQNAGRMWASSMGLSCVVASGVDTLTVTVAWGRYVKAEVLDDAGNPRRCWSRECTERPIVLVVGASNQWFAQTLSALAVPQVGASALQAKVEQLWGDLQNVREPAVLDFAWTMPAFQALHQWSKEEVLEAITQHRKTLESGPEDDQPAYPDLRTPEWEVFSSPVPPEPTDDFTLRRDPDGVPTALAGFLSDVAQAERLREVRALTGFTRLDAPDPEDPDLVTRAPLARDRPGWVPASEVRGEGIFLRFDPALLASWEAGVRDSDAVREHMEAFKRFRTNRYSGRLRTDFDPLHGWPGPQYIALHTLSHLLIRAIALECGYSSASLSERIYSGQDQGGILIYTAVPDAEGTLGGLVSLAEPAPLTRIVQRALHDARRCSSDPLCAERLPETPADFLHGAACHACLFVSETTCERGNRFLDRRFIVPIDERFPPLIPS